MDEKLLTVSFISLISSCYRILQQTLTDPMYCSHYLPRSVQEFSLKLKNLKINELPTEKPSHHHATFSPVILADLLIMQSSTLNVLQQCALFKKSIKFLYSYGFVSTEKLTFNNVPILTKHHIAC